MAYLTDKDGKIIKADNDDITPETVGMMERADDEAIIQHMTTGDVTEVYIYKYEIATKTGPKTIMGISTDGAHALANEMRNLEVLSGFSFDKDSDPDNIYAVLRVKNLATNVTLVGVGKQCKFVVGAKNEPMRDRPDEHAFVKAVSKAERNGILSHADAKIVQTIIQRAIGEGKTRQIKPPVIQAAPVRATSSQATDQGGKLAAAAKAAAEQDQKLKNLRERVSVKFKADLGYTDEQRHEAVKNKLGLLDGSLLNLSEQQLRDCLAYAEELIDKKAEAPTTVTTHQPDDKDKRPKELGFTGLTEQNMLRSDLYGLWNKPENLNFTKDDFVKYIIGKGYKMSSDIPKAKINELIAEVKVLIENKNKPPEASAPEV